MVSYMACVSSAESGRSALGRAVQALSFMERAGGVPIEQFSLDPASKASFQELSVVTAAGATRPTKKAPRVPL